METTAAIVQQRTRFWRQPTFWLIVLFLGYAVLGFCCVGGGAGGSDSSGYMNQAKALAAGTTQIPTRFLPNFPPDHCPDLLYSPLGTHPARNRERLFLTYPIGLPLLFVAAQPVVGWDRVADVVACLHLLAGVALLYALLRTLDFNLRWSLAGASLLGSSAVYFSMGTQTMSDVPALVWCLAAMLAAWRSRTRTFWSGFAGIAFGMAVLVRPSDILLFLPLAIVFGLNWRLWLLFGLGGLPFALGQLCYNHAAYGAWLVSGYGDIRSLFGKQYAIPTILHYLRWIPIQFSPVAVFALGLPWLARQDRRLALMLAVWIAVFIGFYIFYSYAADTWWYLRFILPAAPALIVAGLWCLRSIFASRRLPRFTSWALMAVLLLHALFWDQKLHALSSKRVQAPYGHAAEWARSHLAPNTVIACMQVSGCLLYYTDFLVVRWDCFYPDQRSDVRAAITASGRPLYAILWPFENPDALKHLGGSWKQVEAFPNFTVWHAEDDGTQPYSEP